MHAELGRVMELQPAWSSKRSPAMDERGRLVRHDLPAWLAADRPALAAAIGIPADELLVEGSDGIGRKSRIPWVRFGSRSRSPSATEGFYAVFLFDAPGDAVYLSLNQGTTELRNGDPRRRSPDLLRERAQRGRDLLAGRWSPPAALVPLRLHDRHGGLGDGYELGDIAAIRYPRAAVPAEPALLADALAFARALGAIYEGEAEAPFPGDEPEVELIEELAGLAVGKPVSGRAAGFRTNADEIRAVEQRAVELARDRYEAAGWTVRVRGKPYDLDVRRGDRHLHVEVKGTTSDGRAVTLTDGEVRHHAARYPDNALVVVRNISLDRSTRPPTASGGELHELRPWWIEPDDLRAIAHRYAVPPSIYG